MHTAKKTPVGNGGEKRNVKCSKKEKDIDEITCCALWGAYERRSGGGGWKFVSDVDPEDSVAQQDADLEANPCPAVERQVETGDVHQHEENAWDQKPHYVQQGAPTD